ncbi:arylsulfotransferase family protein [Haloquadratum walsbyi]|uniref:Arylsulfotransferase (ASST) n=1 Tax=Haloquadratum walsbyi J07HQW2 TaxID=1238425 RepID=U1PKG4_9EURY|nr:arylsulfotransferase family protein [Haloquadratum walsbyi]ERG94177.1 MAG: arylsulfotransferase (ASST) [Haloquadratum walsbyi J07HQW2]
MPILSVSSVWLFRGFLSALIIISFGVGVVLTATYEPPEIQTGTVEDSALGTTYVAVQGFHFQGEGATKKPARLIAIDEQANPDWIYNGSKRGVSWFYNVDPLPNGNLLSVNTVPGQTLVYELEAETRDRVWQQNLSITDTHDVDLINGNQLLVANMREYDENNGTSNDRLFIYDLSKDKIIWEWYFKNHYPNETDGGMNDDWSHVNDVDKIEDGRYLVSPRNFDQVIVVNRSTKDITMRLGADQEHIILNEQHDPQYLESKTDTPTILVADSENDRVVEYSCVDRSETGECQWQQVWVVGDDQLNWPRDADRLPNGNTLIVDSLGHRVIEVTPTGKIIWEAYTPWAPFDVERAAYGNEAGGPTMLDQNISGSYQLSGSAGETPGTGTGTATTFPEWIKATMSGTPLSSAASGFAETWEGVSQWIKPIWMAPWSLVYFSLDILLVFILTTVEIIAHRSWISSRIRQALGRVRHLGSS